MSLVTVDYYHNLDLKKVSELLNARVHNVTTSERTTLGTSLGVDNTGLHVYDTDLDLPYYWTGTAWAPAAPAAGAFARTYFQSGITTVAGTPFIVTHSLGLADKDAFTISVKNSAGKEISVGVDSVNVNSLTISTSVALTGLKVFVVGY